MCAFIYFRYCISKGFPIHSPEAFDVVLIAATSVSSTLKLAFVAGNRSGVSLVRKGTQDDALMSLLERLSLSLVWVKE